MNSLIKSMTTPIVWGLILIMLGLLVAWLLRKKRRSYLGWLPVILAGLLLYTLSIPAVSGQLVYSLECQFRLPPADTLDTLDVIVVLGAGHHPSWGLRHYAEPSGIGYARVCGAVAAFEQSGARSVAFCEGRGEREPESGAEVMKELAIRLGVQEDEVIVEDTSRNTMENAARLRKLLPREKRLNIGLVTSAIHMSRAERVFKKAYANDTIVAIPVAYLYDPPQSLPKSLVPSAYALQLSTYAVHERIGMLWYGIRY